MSKLRITKKGKIVLAFGVTVLLLATLAISSAVYKNQREVMASQSFSYAIHKIEESAIKNELNVRTTLTEKMKISEKLIKDSEGKVFTASRANLQTYLDSISALPKTKFSDDDETITYVNSRNRVLTALNELNKKNAALQKELSQWTEKKEAQTKEDAVRAEKETGSDTERAKIEEELRQGVQDTINKSAEREAAERAIIAQKAAELAKKQEAERKAKEADRIEKERIAKEKADKEKEDQESVSPSEKPSQSPSVKPSPTPSEINIEPSESSITSQSSSPSL